MEYHIVRLTINNWGKHNDGIGLKKSPEASKLRSNPLLGNWGK